MRRTSVDTTNRRSVAWWDGWKEGYKLGLRDGSKRQQESPRDRKISRPEEN